MLYPASRLAPALMLPALLVPCLAVASLQSAPLRAAPVPAAPVQIAATITPAGKGKPSGTKGGGSRPTKNACFRSSVTPDVALSALSPAVANAEMPAGLTSRDRPTFTVYVPATIARQIEFSLLDEHRNGIFQTTFSAPGQAGFLGIQLPATAPPLTPGQTYHWAVVLICNPRDRTEDWVTQSTIQRTALAPFLEQAIAQSSPLERIDLYQNHDLWYDAIATALELHQADPTQATLSKRWSELLQLAGFNPLDPPRSPITTLKQ